jgi:hypothetical protein
MARILYKFVLCRTFEAQFNLRHEDLSCPVVIDIYLLYKHVHINDHAEVAPVIGTNLTPRGTGWEMAMQRLS